MNTSEQGENLCRRGPLIDDWPSADVYPPQQDEPDEMCASRWKLPCCGRFRPGHRPCTRDPSRIICHIY